jgi:hypothetical protein
VRRFALSETYLKACRPAVRRNISTPLTRSRALNR